MSSIRSALHAFRGRQAVVVGDLMLDAYLFGETVRVSREAPVLVVRKEKLEHRLGGAANAAANLAALGVTTRLVGVIGSDEPAQRLCQMLEGSGVEALLHTREMTTPVKTRIFAGAHGTSRQQVLRLDEEPSADPIANAAQTIARDLERHAADADVIVVSDYGFGALSPPVVEAVQRLAGAGQIVCVDSRYNLAAFTGVTVVTPNVPEAEALTGRAIPDQSCAERAARAIVERLGCKACLLTRGRRGMTLSTVGGDPSHVAIVGGDEVTDVTGAGDTVIATFAAALAGGLGMENGMRLANCAAGTVVTRLGTAAVVPAELIAAVERHDVEILPWGG